MVTVSYDVRTVRLRVPVLVMRRSLAGPVDRVVAPGLQPSRLTAGRRATAERLATAEARRRQFVDAALALRAGAGL